MGEGGEGAVILTVVGEELTALQCNHLGAQQAQSKTKNSGKGTKNSGKGKKTASEVYEIEAFNDVSDDGKVYLVKWKGGYMCITPWTQRNPPGPPFTPRTQTSRAFPPPARRVLREWCCTGAKKSLPVS